MILKILKRLLIIQEVSNRGLKPKRGRGFDTAMRFNPYNPLSYITLVFGALIGLMCFGLVGFWKEVDLINPFKWN